MPGRGGTDATADAVASTAGLGAWPLWTGSAPAVTFARQPIRAGRGDARLSASRHRRALVFASTRPESSGRGQGDRPVTTLQPTRLGRSAVPGLPQGPYGFGRPERGPLTVLGGQGLLVQNMIPGPAEAAGAGAAAEECLLRGAGRVPQRAGERPPRRAHRPGLWGSQPAPGRGTGVPATATASWCVALPSLQSTFTLNI